MTRFATQLEREAKLADLERERQRQREERARIREAQAPRSVLGACWLCGSTSGLPEGLTRFSLPLPLGQLDGTLCAACRGTRGDLPEVVARRLWQARPELPESWEWTPFYKAPDPKDPEAIRLWREDGISQKQVAEGHRFSVPAEWSRYTWAHHVFEHRRAKPGKSGPTPRKPFGWLK